MFVTQASHFISSFNFTSYISIQLCNKIIPTFEHLHGPRYQALMMVDNSQGHSAYSKDMLLVSQTNFQPSRKQAHMQNRWFMQDGIKFPQEMNFLLNHLNFWINQRACIKSLSNVASGKMNFEWHARITVLPTICCCTKKILEGQPDFRAQQSLVQEVIEEAGHHCIFLPKFHCEVNFIEFFWGAIKQWVWEYCDYTFSGLQEHLPMALASVNILTIQKWEDKMIWWIEAYRSGLSAQDAQLQVKNFSSHKYTSHHCIPESLACQFDQ